MGRHESRLTREKKTSQTMGFSGGRTWNEFVEIVNIVIRMKQWMACIFALMGIVRY